MVIAEQFLAVDLPQSRCCAWYAAYTRSRHEKVVHLAAEAEGLESFLPLRQVLSRWKDRRKLVEKPLFPGYVFVQASASELYRVRAIRGVAYIVGDAVAPTPVADDQLEAVRKMVQGPYPTESWPGLQVGRRVQVTSGPLAGLETCILRRKRNGKSYLVVTVDLLGRSVAVEIDPSCVEPIL